MKEKYLQSKILKALRAHGGWWTKYHVGPRYAQAGVPDILGCYKRRFIALEVKVPGNKPTKLQAETIRKIREHGKGLAFVIYSVDDAMTILYSIDRREQRGKATGNRRVGEPGRSGRGA